MDPAVGPVQVKISGTSAVLLTRLAERMGTSQGQITRFESGADTRLSTVARYAAAVGMKVEWNLAPLANATGRKSHRRAKRPTSST